MYAQVNSVGVVGLDTFMVSAEADISNGAPKFDIVGLPDTAVQESRERVRTAMLNSGFQFPPERITVNLAPANIKKAGPTYDLPILLALLKSTGFLDMDLSDSAFVGELSMNGQVKRVDGCLPMVLEARKRKIKKIFVPKSNEAEASVADSIEIYPVESVVQLINFLCGREEIRPCGHHVFTPGDRKTYGVDFSDVRGQLQAKRALEVAAAGGHNVLMIGSPGSGKSMLAKRIPTILPDMTFEESLETTKIYSVAGKLPEGVPLITTRPFVSPHHSVSAAGLTGGGSVPKPGAVSLSDNGVLFLDELPEFSRQALEALRQPIEDGKVSVTRVAGTLTYPCRIMLVCAMNPCPCGYFGHPTRKCTCPPGAPQKYLQKVSGPLLDRLDIHIEVPPVKYEELTGEENQGESSSEIKKRVNAARAVQNERFKGSKAVCNAQMSAEMTKEFCVLDDAASRILKAAFDRMGLSARAYDKILRVSRTIADLAGSEIIRPEHVSEAIQYRSLDRKFWQSQ